MSNQKFMSCEIIRAKRGAGPFAPEAPQRLQAFLRVRWEEGESLQLWANAMGLSHAMASKWRAQWGSDQAARRLCAWSR